MLIVFLPAARVHDAGIARCGPSARRSSSLRRKCRPCISGCLPRVKLRICFSPRERAWGPAAAMMRSANGNSNSRRCCGPWLNRASNAVAVRHASGRIAFRFGLEHEDQGMIRQGIGITAKGPPAETYSRARLHSTAALSLPDAVLRSPRALDHAREGVQARARRAGRGRAPAPCARPRMRHRDAHHRDREGPA